MQAASQSAKLDSAQIPPPATARELDAAHKDDEAVGPGITAVTDDSMRKLCVDDMQAASQPAKPADNIENKGSPIEDTITQTWIAKVAPLTPCPFGDSTIYQQVLAIPQEMVGELYQEHMNIRGNASPPAFNYSVDRNRVLMFEYLRRKHKPENHQEFYRLSNAAYIRIIVEYSNYYPAFFTPKMIQCYESIFYDCLYHQLASLKEGYAPIAIVGCNIENIQRYRSIFYNAWEYDRTNEMSTVKTDDYEIAPLKKDFALFTFQVKQCTVFLFQIEPNQEHPNGCCLMFHRIAGAHIQLGGLYGSAGMDLQDIANKLATKEGKIKRIILLTSNASNDIDDLVEQSQKIFTEAEFRAISIPSVITDKTGGFDCKFDAGTGDVLIGTGRWGSKTATPYYYQIHNIFEEAFSRV